MTRSLAVAVALSVGLGIAGLRAEEAAKPDAAKAGKGQQVYAAQHCSMCHSIAGKGNPKTPLDDVGSKMTADYQMVSTGTTGHAESVQIKYDPKKISYGKILQIFFSVAHDPTQLNRQGPDSGTQYRSAIFTTSDEQKKVAEAYVAQLNSAKAYKKPIVTKVGPLEGFYPAEAYHQDYLTLHPSQPYIAYNDLPKIENLKKIFAENYIEKPTLVSSAKVTN